MTVHQAESPLSVSKLCGLAEEAGLRAALELRDRLRQVGLLFAGLQCTATEDACPKKPRYHPPASIEHLLWRCSGGAGPRHILSCGSILWRLSWSCKSHSMQTMPLEAVQRIVNSQQRVLFM